MHGLQKISRFYPLTYLYFSDTGYNKILHIVTAQHLRFMDETIFFNLLFIIDIIKNNKDIVHILKTFIQQAYNKNLPCWYHFKIYHISAPFGKCRESIKENNVHCIKGLHGSS